MKTVYKTTAIVVTYIILASVCCKFMAVAFYYPASLFGDVKIVRSPMLNSDKFDHVYLTVDDHAFEPRFLGLSKSNNVNYYEITSSFNNPEEFLKTDTILPPILSVIKAIFK